MLRPQLCPTHEGGEVIPAWRDGAQHYLLLMADLGPVEQLLAVEAGSTPAPRAWSRGEFA